MRHCKILIADDHSVVAFGIQLILKNLSPFYTFEFDEAANGHETIALVKKRPYDLIILDINMPDTDTFGLVADILAHKQGNRIMIYSSNPEALYAKRLYKLGVTGYLSKQAPASELHKAIMQALNGETYISGTMKEQLLYDIKTNHKSTSNPFDALTNREIQVAHCLVNGESIADIKNKLQLHPSSIGTYKTRIFQKLQVSSIYDLSKLAAVSGFN